MTAYEQARRCMALCHRCPLSGVGDLVENPAGPVYPEDSGQSWLAVVGRDPGNDEQKEGRTFVGASGREAMRSLAQVGVCRQEVLWLNGIACQTPRNDPQAFSIRVSRQNRKARALWELAVAAGVKEWRAVGAGKDPQPGDAPWSALEGTAVDASAPPLLLQPLTACNGMVKWNLARLARRCSTAATDPGPRKAALRVLAFGSFGLKAVGLALGGSEGDRSILDVRGTLWELGGKDADGTTKPHGVSWLPQGALVRVLPTVHPAFVLRMARWRKVFDVDVSRAIRWFRGRLGWVEPTTRFVPSPQELDAFLRSDPQGQYIWDIETLKGVGKAAYDPLDDRLGCIGFATSDGKRAMVVPLLGIDGETKFYNEWDERAVRDILRAFFVDPTRVKIGWNSGYYDTIAIEQHFGVTPAPQLDGILVHRSVESELPHSLAFAGSIYTDVQDWKGDNTAKEPRNDQEWWAYNCKDVAVTARVMVPLLARSRERGMVSCVKWDHKRQAVCRGLHRAGLRIDETARMEWEVKLSAERRTHIADCRRLIGQPEAGGELGGPGAKVFNPNSVQQVSRILFHDFGFTPTLFTDTGEPSTADDVLRGYLIDQTITADQRAFLLALRRARRTQKLLGTYILPMRPDCLRNGRTHPNYSAHSMVSQRVSSSGPNAQNWPRKLRNIVVAAPGNVLVGADADQLELRYAAALAGATSYLEAFTAKRDPHAMSAAMCFGEKFTSLDPEKDKINWNLLRDLAKRFVYLTIYGGSAETAWEALTSAEDKDGNLIYSDLELREMKLLRRNWLAAAPQFEAWWDRTVELFRKQGYLRDSVLGMRRDFLDGEDFNELANFDAQSGGSGVVWLGTFDLLERYPFEKWGPGTGLICQVHDALYFEVPEAKADEVAAAITKAMTRRVPGLDVDFTAKAKPMLNWRDERKDEKKP